MNQNKVLSQSEIDALLLPTPMDQEIPAEEPKIVTISPNMRGDRDSPMADNSALDSIQTTVTQLAERLDNMDTTLAGLAIPDKSVDAVKTVVHAMQQDFQAVMQRLETLTGQVESILHGLQGTLGHDMRSAFKCRSCDSEESVAARIKCTSCGTENWWGWWPST